MLIQSQVIAAGSGSAGGLTLSRNRSGMYFRARAVPVNPGSTFQQQVRNAVAELVSAWIEDLTPAQRDAWENYAANVPFVNALGAQIFLTGQNMYVRSNVPRLQVNSQVPTDLLPRVDDGPTVYDLPTFSVPTIAISAGSSGQLEVTFNDSDDWVSEDDAAMLIYAGREFNASRAFFKGPYQLGSTLQGDATTPPTSPFTGSSNFVYTAGNEAVCQVRVTRADGRLSSPARIFDVIS